VQPKHPRRDSGRRRLRALLLALLLGLATLAPAAALEPLGGTVTLGYDRLTARIPVFPDRRLIGPSLNLRGGLAHGAFRLEAEARLRRLRTGSARHDLRWLDLHASYGVTDNLRLGLYQTRFPTRLRNGHAESHRWRATGVSLTWQEGPLTLQAIAGTLDGNGGGRARETGLRAEVAPTPGTVLGLMGNEVRGRSGAFRYTTTGAYAAHSFAFGLTGWLAIQDLRVRPGIDRMRTRSAGLAQRIEVAGQPVVLSVEASRTTPRTAMRFGPERMDMVRFGVTLPLGPARGARGAVPLNSTLAAMQRRPNFLFGFFDTVAAGL
jgi:hypothetical protein